MPVSLFNRNENNINTKLLCTESRDYLKKLRNHSQPLPEILAWKKLFSDVEKNDPDNKKKNILEKLVEIENKYQTECKQHLQYTQNKTKKLTLWAIAVALLTSVLLAVGS